MPPHFNQQNQQQVAGKTGTATTATSEEPSNVSTITLLQKEHAVDNIWRAVGNLTNIRTQRNYERVIKKRTLQEMERFEEKAEGWLAEYREFVDGGHNCKQPRF